MIPRFTSRLHCLQGALIRQPSFVLRGTFTLSPPSNNNGYSMVRNVFIKPKTNHRIVPNQQLARQAFQQSPTKHKRRAPIYLLAFISLIVVGAYVDTDDDYFFYFHPLPFAFNIGSGPSMLPTIPLGIHFHLRDCWSHRLFWLDINHFKNCLSSLLSDRSTTQQKISFASFRRPWKKGDIVTLYNPFTESLNTKRIVGLGGDSIQVFGEYAHEFNRAMEVDGITNHTRVDNDCGVPRDERYPTTFCRRVSLDGRDQPLKQLCHYETTLIVPENHVWLEGDNPLFSIDSRHYGPLPVSSLRGRIVLYLWPMSYNSKLHSKRPTPFMNDEWLEMYGILQNDVQKPKN